MHKTPTRKYFMINYCQPGAVLSTGKSKVNMMLMREEGRQVSKPSGHSVIRTGVMRKSVVTKGGLLIQP